MNSSKSLGDMIDVLDKTYRVFRDLIDREKIKKEFIKDFVEVLPGIKDKIEWSKKLIHKIQPHMISKLKKYGLYGIEFNLKKKIFDNLYKQWEQNPGNVHKIKQLLDCINSILGSMALVFSPLHAVKEFKEMIEISMDDIH